MRRPLLGRPDFTFPRDARAFGLALLSILGQPGGVALSEIHFGTRSAELYRHGAEEFELLGASSARDAFRISSSRGLSGFSRSPALLVFHLGHAKASGLASFEGEMLLGVGSNLQRREWIGVRGRVEKVGGVLGAVEEALVIDREEGAGER